MRTTLRIDDDLLMLAKRHAQREGVPVSEWISRCIRRGMQVAPESLRTDSKPYREQVFSMGQPTMNLTKALALAAWLACGF